MTSSSGPPPSGPAPSSRERPSWSTGRAPNRVAAFPDGMLGRLGGELMRRGNARQQREVAAVLDPLLGPPGGGRAADVVEIGSGPGVLLGILAGRATAGNLTGIDPSPAMRRAAARSLTTALSAGRVRILPGDAGCTGLPGGAADVVVSVNSVAIWPDLDAGLDELVRVLRPGGHLVLSWHGGYAPTRSGAAMSLPAAHGDRLERALCERLVDVRRELTARCALFLARRPPPLARASSPGAGPAASR